MPVLRQHRYSHEWFVKRILWLYGNDRCTFLAKENRYSKALFFNSVVNKMKVRLLQVLPKLTAIDVVDVYEL